MRLVKNAAQCSRCEDVIESKYRHHFVSCRCGAISVDGGLAYLRRSFSRTDDLIELSEYETDDGARVPVIEPGRVES